MYKVHVLCFRYRCKPRGAGPVSSVTFFFFKCLKYFTVLWLCRVGDPSPGSPGCVGVQPQHEGKPVNVCPAAATVPSTLCCQTASAHAWGMRPLRSPGAPELVQPVPWTGLLLWLLLPETNLFATKKESPLGTGNEGAHIHIGNRLQPPLSVLGRQVYLWLEGPLSSSSRLKAGERRRVSEMQLLKAEAQQCMLPSLPCM